MRKLFTILVLCFINISLNAGKWIDIGSSTPEPAKIRLISTSGETTVFKLNVDGFEMLKVNTGLSNAFVISLEETTPLLVNNAPDIPKLTTSLIIGNNSDMQVEVLSSSYKEFSNIDIAPSKGNLLRTVDPNTVPYIYGKVYNINSFYPGDLVDLREPYFIREYRGQTVVLYPFQYNPVTKILRVYSELIIKVSNSDPNAKGMTDPVSAPALIDMEFEKIYDSHFLNFNKTSKYTPVSEQGKMLIISYGPFMAEMQDFVNWKNTIGIPTEMVDVSTIGGTAAIKSYVSNYYNTQGLTFLLLVGDAAQVPSSSNGYGDSDNDYGYVVGNDHYPDIFVGRFSAETTAHVQTQVERTIEYELNPLVFPEWYNKGIGIASNQGPGDDNEMDYEHVRNMQIDLLSFTYTNCPELFDGSQGGLDAPGNPTPAMVAAEVNSGSGVILYTGHGSYDGWGSSNFSNSDVNSLTNLRKLPFIWSVACSNGDFVNHTCFGEAWLRATNNGEPTGAIATLMSTISQSWDPPMSGQDEMVDILVESYANNIKRTFGGISMNGCMQMIDDYGAGGETMTDTWNCFGDPSVIVRTDTPKVITATHNNTIFIGAAQFQVNCNVDDAYVCLTLDNQIIGTGYVTAGLASINFNPLLTLDTMTIAITAFNYIPYLAEIPVIPASGPFVIYNGHNLDDNAGNSNGKADYGESLLVDLEIRNVGIDTADNIFIKLTTQDQYITMIDSSEYYGNIVPDSVLLINGGFAFDVADSLPDQHKALVNFSATDGTNLWSAGLTINLNAPVISFDNYTISDPAGNNNGKVDQGETVDMNIIISNTGSSEAVNVSGVLITNDPYVTINTSSAQVYGNINAGANTQKVYSISAAMSTPAGHQATFSFHAAADSSYSCDKTFTIIIGRIPICIIDLDQNNNSSPEMENAIQNLGLNYNYFTSFPPDMNLYSSVFLCLGVYYDNYVLDNTEGQLLADYLNNGGCLYMEGGDTWYYDQQTPVHQMFNVNAVADGSSDLGTINGATATFTDGMVFTYSGENNYIDHIDPINPAFSIFTNDSPVYGTGVAYDQGTYKTIAASHEFGGLDDTNFPSTKEELMAQYLEFFGLYTDEVHASFFAIPTTSCVGEAINFYDNSTGNNFMWYWNFYGGTPAWSSQKNPTVIYNTPGTFDVVMIVSDGMNLDTLIIQDYITVLDHFLLSTNASPAIISVGDTSHLSVIPAGGSGSYTYSWTSVPPGFTSIIPNPEVNPLVSTTYAVEVFDGYCVEKDSITVIVSNTTSTINGFVTYHNLIQTPIDNTWLILTTLNNNKVDSTITDMNGNYAFQGVLMNDYQISIDCQKNWGGVNASDGLAIMRHFVGFSLLTGLELLAADVDGSGYVNTSDALMCVKRFVNLISNFPAGDWICEDDTLEIIGGTTFNYDPNILCYGDVDASYTPPVGKHYQNVELLMNGSTIIKKDEIIEVPVSVERNTSIGAMSLVFEYPARFLEFAGLKFLHQSSFYPVFNDLNGEVRIGWYDLDEINLESGDEILTLQFKPSYIHQWPEEGIKLVLGNESEIVDGSSAPLDDLLIYSPKLVVDYNLMEFELLGNFPNPFNNRTEIKINLPEDAIIRIDLYSITGERVLKIIENEYFNAGISKIILERKDLKTGAYIYRVIAEGEKAMYTGSQRMIIH